MIVHKVPIVENGTMNGHICHQQFFYTSCNPINYCLETNSAGIGHPKHGSSYQGMAGQDVYGHTSQSIFVADGHGKNGSRIANDSIPLVSILENAIHADTVLRNPYRVEQTLRSIVVDYIKNIYEAKSGCTFTQMTFIQHGSRRWAITVNVGDSEALLVFKNKIQICSFAHVWDNKDLYQRYIQNSSIQKPVCYNRWNASSYRLKNQHGQYRPIMLYNVEKNKVFINKDNAEWISTLWERRSKPQIKYGTQSVRVPANPHENWGSCVLIGGQARGQVMASIGDNLEREQSGVPFELVHVYIHEIPAYEDVIGIVQSDGISNRLTVEECGLRAWSSQNANDYIKNISKPRDDMSVGFAYSFAK